VSVDPVCAYRAARLPSPTAHGGERTDQGSGLAANECAAKVVAFESPALL